MKWFQAISVLLFVGTLAVSHVELDDGALLPAPHRSFEAKLVADSRKTTKPAQLLNHGVVGSDPIKGASWESWASTAALSSNGEL